jgi:hypothetical protein
MQETTAVVKEMDRRWAECLSELSCRMSPATFDTWLAGSRLLALDGDGLTLGVVHGAAAEWLEHRFLPACRDTIDRHFPGLAAVHARPLAQGSNGNGAWEAGAAPAAEGEAQSPAGAGSGVEEDEAIECDSVTDPALARFDVSQSGWSKLANYALDFWAELLGPTAFQTWQVIRHEDMRRIKTEWTPTMTFSVSHLARKAAGGNRKDITGVWRACRAASIVERGEPCAHCAERGGQIEAAHRCRYRSPGALDRLQAEGVAVVERRGEGQHVTYRLRVFTLLPLLTPAQVADLHPATQQDHNRWLLRQGLDPASWERLTVRHLALPPL